MKYTQDDFSSAIYHQEFKNEKNLVRSVEVRNMTKVFGLINGFKAVDDISFCLYESQIFCLLGHNGAGKTTSISLLTGLLPKTKGKVKMYDYDLDYDLEEMRSTIGLCNQKDVLFENYTIEEHLHFMCKIKGIADE